VVELLTHWVLGLPPLLMCLLPALVVVSEPVLVPAVVAPSVGSMLLLGFLAHAGRVPLEVAVPTGIAAAVTGDSLAFLIGRRWTVRRDRLRSALGADRFDRAERLTHRLGGPAVVLARFLTGLRTLVPRLCALSGMRYRRYAAWSVPAGLVWGSTFVLAGYAAGAEYGRVADAVGTGGLIALAALVVLAGTAGLVARRRRNRHPAVPAEPAPASADPVRAAGGGFGTGCRVGRPARRLRPDQVLSGASYTAGHVDGRGARVPVGD
jgi:membrane protein DedA with SNARE-associated domain